MELREAIMMTLSRLGSLVDNLLDLSRLRTGTAEPSHGLVLDRGGRSRPCSDDLASPRAFPALDRSTASRLSVPTPPSSSGRSSTCSPTRRGTRPASAVSVRAREVSGTGRGQGQRSRPRDRRSGSASGSSRPSTAARTAPRIRGRGSGLAIVKGFVEANGGQVWVESLPGQGTTFVFEFPLGWQRDEPTPTRRCRHPAGR